MAKEKEVVIRVKGVYKDFSYSSVRSNTLKGVFMGIFKNQDKVVKIQHALKDISFEIKKGEFFGIVGRNGSGKSTLLKIIAGIYQPSKGHIAVNGKLVPFIELGVGFNPELTGKENVYLNGAMLGFSDKEVDKFYDEVVEFAELEKFMDKKLKNYSSGMQVRLAFSVAIRAKADVLLVDEVLAVGDADFQRKCFSYFKKLKKAKKTVVFVTHDMTAVVEYCDRALLIDDSRVVSIGEPRVIATKYTRMFNKDSRPDEAQSDKRWGDGMMCIQKATITPKVIKDGDKSLSLEVEILAKKDVEDPVVGFLIKNASGQQLLGTNTKVKKLKLGAIKEGSLKVATWQIPNIFGDGEYFVDTAISHSDGVSQYDWWEESTKFRVYNEEKTPYSINPQLQVKLTNKRR